MPFRFSHTRMLWAVRSLPAVLGLALASVALGALVPASVPALSPSSPSVSKPDPVLGFSPIPNGGAAHERALGLAPSSAWAQSAGIRSLALTLGTADAFGQAEPGTEIALELIAADGTLLAQDGTDVGFLGFFALSLANTGGSAVAVEPGRRVRLIEAGTTRADEIVPAMSIDGDSDTDRVFGAAPPGAALTVSASSGFGLDVAPLPAVAGPDGVFEVSFDGVYDLEPDTTLAAVLERGQLSFRIERPLARRVSLRLFDSVLTGLVESGAEVTARTSGPDGSPRGEGNGTALLAGRFLLGLSDAGGTDSPVRPGERLEIDVAPGGGAGEAAAYSLVVPRLSAEPDVEADSVSGDAPAGAPVAVTIGGTRATANADSAGRYRVDFTGALDILPGTTGQVETRLAQGGMDYEIRRAWGVTRLALFMGEADLDGTTSVGEPVLLTLRRPDGGSVPGGPGRVVGTAVADVAAGGVFGGGGTFSARLEDLEARHARILPGDSLEFQHGPEAFDLEIPVLTAEVDTTSDAISGRAPAGTEVTVTARRLLAMQTRTVRSDTGGNYAVDFAGALDIVGGSAVTVRIELPGGHSLTLRTAAANLRVFPEEARLTGVAPSLAQLEATVFGADGVRRGAADGAADLFGNFDLSLRGADGAYYPVAGDVVRLRFGSTVREMIVPGLAFEWDTERELVFGETTAEGVIEVLARPPADQGNSSAVRTADVPGSGAWATDFEDETDLRAASRLRVTYTFENGDSARIDRVLPYVNAQVGGTAVDGFALPRAELSARMESRGTLIGSAETTVRGDHGFALRMASSSGEPARIVGGAIIALEYAGEILERTIPELSVRAAAAESEIGGRGPVSAALAVRLEPPAGPTRNISVVADAAGKYSFGLPDGVATVPGLRVETSWRDGDGHRFYALSTVARLTAYIGTSRLDGEADPLAEAVLAARGSTAPAAHADTRGEFTVDLPGVELAAGDRIAGGVGEQPVGMTVSDVSIEADTRTDRIAGSFPVADGSGIFERLAPVYVYLRGQSEPTIYIALADEDGDFELDTSRPPLFSPVVSLARATRVEVVYTDGDGHRTVATAALQPLVFLPFGQR